MNASKWLKWIVIGGIALIILGVGASLISTGTYGRIGTWGYDDCGMGGDWGMMGRRSGYGMIGDRSLGWFGMLLGLFIPLGLIILIVAGIAWLWRASTSNGSNFAQAIPTSNTCPSCGKNVQTDWLNCPFCGATIDQ